MGAAVFLLSESLLLSVLILDRLIDDTIVQLCIIVLFVLSIELFNIFTEFKGFVLEPDLEILFVESVIKFDQTVVGR